jgi:SAM-dependent methyltransferase
MTSTRTQARMSIPWVSDELIDFGDVRVELCVPPALYERQTADGHFIIGKSRGMIEDELRVLGDRSVERMVDVGVYKGGSVVLFHKLLAPRKLVAIELHTTPLPPLDDYVARHAREIRVARGVNQADFATVDGIYSTEFGNEPLDLVVDDASHFYRETRATFQTLFPRLRPGGLYVIEDWSWAHWRGDYWQAQRGGEYFSDKEPLTNLLIELILLCATSPEIVARVDVAPGNVYVERGARAVRPGFELSNHYVARGESAPRFPAAPVAARTLYDSQNFFPTQALRS